MVAVSQIIWIIASCFAVISASMTCDECLAAIGYVHKKIKALESTEHPTEEDVAKSTLMKRMLHLIIDVCSKEMVEKWEEQIQSSTASITTESVTSSGAFSTILSTLQNNTESSSGSPNSATESATQSSTVSETLQSKTSQTTDESTNETSTTSTEPSSNPVSSTTSQSEDVTTQAKRDSQVETENIPEDEDEDEKRSQSSTTVTETKHSTDVSASSNNPDKAALDLLQDNDDNKPAENDILRQKVERFARIIFAARDTL